MKRISIVLAGALACLLLASLGTAAAMPQPEPETPKVKTTCVTHSKNVIGRKQVTIRVVGRNVAKSQRRFARCRVVKKVANKMLSLRIEEPKVFAGYRCTPRVVHTSPDVVKYNCLFRGADTATEIRLKFTARYDLD